MTYLSAYDYACGGVSMGQYRHYDFTMWKDHGVYHFRVINSLNFQRVTWVAFDTLKEVKSFVREFKQNCRDNGSYILNLDAA